jgi:hypothetical protein
MLSRRRLVQSSLALSLAGALPARAAGAPIVAKIKLIGDRVIIGAMMNGQGPYPLIVDTGAVVSGLNASLIDRLKLRKLRDVRLNNRPFALYAVDDMVLGGQIRQSGVAMFSLENVNLGGEGLLAAGMVTAIDSEMDFEREEWRLYPNGGIDRSGYTKLKSDLRKGSTQTGSARIHAEITLGDTAIMPVWDTGMPWLLSLENSDARKLGLWNDKTPYSPYQMRGVGQPARELSRIVRAPTLKIGPATYENPLIIIRGPWEHSSSLLGLPAIRTLNLSVDPAADKLWVARNGLPPGRPMSYNGSGLWVDEDKGVVSVSDVGVGSPAAKAGIQAGDVIIGVATVREALPLINRRLGDTVTLPLKRGGQTIEARFVLSSYL